MSHPKNSNIQQNQFASSSREKSFIDLSESDTQDSSFQSFDNTKDSSDIFEDFFEPKEKFKEGTSKGQGGRPRAEIWNYFQSMRLKTGHYRAKCYYCYKDWAKGEPVKLEMHLGFKCLKCPEDIREYWVSKVVEKQNNYQRTPETKKRKADQTQTNITSHFKSNVALPLAEQNSLDQAVLKAWVAAGVPFSVIENPFIIDLFMRLNPSYTPPSRTTLSGHILIEEVAKIKNRVNEVLKYSENLTLYK